MVQYRANIILDWLLGMFALIVPFAFWKTAYAWQAQISGYGMADMPDSFSVIYFLSYWSALHLWKFY